MPEKASGLSDDWRPCMVCRVRRDAGALRAYVLRIRGGADIDRLACLLAISRRLPWTLPGLDMKIVALLMF
jgi:hypothetical protein